MTQSSPLAVGGVLSRPKTSSPSQANVRSVAEDGAEHPSRPNQADDEQRLQRKRKLDSTSDEDYPRSQKRAIVDVSINDVPVALHESDESYGTIIPSYKTTKDPVCAFQYDDGPLIGHPTSRTKGWSIKLHIDANLQDTSCISLRFRFNKEQKDQDLSRAPRYRDGQPIMVPQATHRQRSHASRLTGISEERFT